MSYFQRAREIMKEVICERQRQFLRFGNQIHLPDLDSMKPCKSRYGRNEWAHWYEVPELQIIRRRAKMNQRRGSHNWFFILLEEVVEALQAAAGKRDDLLRYELIQVAAVAVQWVDAIDQRQAKGTEE